MMPEPGAVGIVQLPLSKLSVSTLLPHPRSILPYLLARIYWL